MYDSISGFSGDASRKESACHCKSTGDTGSIPGLGRYPGLKKMATHCSILAWKIPWTVEAGRLQSMGSQRVGHDWACTIIISHGSIYAKSKNLISSYRFKHLIHQSWYTSFYFFSTLCVCNHFFFFSFGHIPWRGMESCPPQRKHGVITTTRLPGNSTPLFFFFFLNSCLLFFFFAIISINSHLDTRELNFLMWRLDSFFHYSQSRYPEKGGAIIWIRSKCSVKRQARVFLGVSL